MNFTFVVEEQEAPRLLRLLHAQFFSDSGDARLFGPRWSEIQGETAATAAPSKQELPPGAWWRKKREDLIAHATNQTPAYVYDRETIQTQIDHLQKIDAVRRFHYAVKANSHPEVLRQLADNGMHFDCVSTAEIDYLRECVPGLTCERILFTPNFAPIDEYIYALELGCAMTIDNVHPLEHHGEKFRGSQLLIRVDSGIARGHHEHVITTGPKSKFGVSHRELERVLDLAAKADAEVIGLHAHVGSGILAPDTWAQSAQFLARLASEIPTARILDLGGGLGIAEKPGQTPLDTEAIQEHLALFSEEFPAFELWMEPGRYLVAEAGVLLSKVTQIKEKDGKIFVGIDAGMNNLIRPSLYGSWHLIANLSRVDARPEITADVVGPICESGDTLGHARSLPATKEGDIIVIANAGAYGKVMESNYNLRSPAGEVFLGKQ